MTGQTLSLQQAEAGLAELRALAKEEYGVELEELALRQDEESRMRLVRLAGIQVKRPFAEPEPRPDHSGNLGAARAWYWDFDKLNDPATEEAPEYRLLEKVRADEGMDKDDLVAIAHEAGLMYVVGRWLYEKMTEEQARTFIEIYHARRSKETDLAINIANLLPVVSFFAGLTGVPALGVSLAMLLVQYGFEKLTDPEPGPDA